MREEVKWFSKLMNQRLEENSHKDKYGWKNISFFDLADKVYSLAEGLQEVENDKEAISKAINIANYCMMIADNCKEGE